MAVLELYGKCKELGYCDCGGFFGCRDPQPPAPKPVIENELEAASKQVAQAERENVSFHTQQLVKREVEIIEERESRPTCEACGKWKKVNHVCKANAEPKECGYCKKRGGPCSRHGGERSGVHTAKKYQHKQAELAELPEPVDVTVPEPQPEPELETKPPVEKLNEVQVKESGKRIVIEVGDVKITIEPAA